VLIHGGGQLSEDCPGWCWGGPEQRAADDEGGGARLVVVLCCQAGEFFSGEHQVADAVAGQGYDVLPEGVVCAAGFGKDVQQGQGAEG